MTDYRQLEKDATDEIAGHEITCDPVVVLSLLADKARLERFIEEYSKSLYELKVDNEALRLDSDRYRWLRDKDQLDPRFQHEALTIAFRDLTGGALDGAVDSIMRMDGAASDEG